MQTLKSIKSDVNVEDGKEINGVCGRCGLEVATLKITRPSLDILSNIEIICPNCSAEIKLNISGGFHWGTPDNIMTLSYLVDTFYEDGYLKQNIKAAVDLK